MVGDAVRAPPPGTIYSPTACPLAAAMSLLSSALKPSLPISPHTQPHSTIALHRACSPRVTAFTRMSSSSRSFMARCTSHACSSDCAALSFAPTGTSRRIVREDDEGEGVGPTLESRVGFWALDALIKRVTLLGGQWSEACCRVTWICKLQKHGK